MAATEGERSLNEIARQFKELNRALIAMNENLSAIGKVLEKARNDVVNEYKEK